MQSNIDQVDPQGPDRGGSRVVRGGGYRNDAEYCLSASRGQDWSEVPYVSGGFRVVLELSEEEFLRYARKHRPS
jgi:formylglycine-generating enzyme required for sulfatase activity